jgi:MoaD family protein
MSIKVKGYVTFRGLVGERSVEIAEDQALSLRVLLERLGQDIGAEFREQIFEPAGGEVRPHVSVLINGRQWNHLSGGLETELKDGDEIAIFLPIAGGSPQD